MQAPLDKEIQNLTVKAKIYGWSPERLEEEKTKLMEHNMKFSEVQLTEEELQEREAKAVELGYNATTTETAYEAQKREEKRKVLIQKAEGVLYDTDKVIVPPPMSKKVVALEFTDPQIPGEIKIDTSGKLLKRFFEYEGQIGSLIDQYNNFITIGLPKQIMSKTLKIEKGVIRFENVILNKPLQKDISGDVKPVYPQEARNSGWSYTSDIYVDMVLETEGSEERMDKVFLGKLPVMLGTQLDWLTAKSPEEKVKLGESLADPFGYFVIKGAEKIVLIQEKLRANRFFIFNSDTKGTVVCKITNNTLAGSSQITMLQSQKSGILKVHLGFLGRLGSTASDKVGKTISVFQIFRMLGMSDPKTIMNHIFLFTKQENIKKMYVALQPNVVKLSKVSDDIDYISKKKGLGDLHYSLRKADIMKDLLAQLFPQVSEDNIQGKIYMLSIMTVRLLEYIIGVRKLDDRDNWGNKQLVTAGKSLELLFTSIWRTSIDYMQNEIDTKKLNGLAAVKASFKQSVVTDSFIESFTANKWGVQSPNSYMKKENITDILKRDSVLSVHSHLTKINTPGSTKVKSPHIRMVQMSQLGYVDAGETPEGQLCGLAKNTAMTAYMSLDRPEEPVIEILREEIAGLPTEEKKNPFMLNGVFIGWVNGVKSKEFLISMRRSLKLPKDVCIVLERDGFFQVYTDAARPTRPLLVVDPDGELVIGKKDLWNVDFQTLIREGCVEYIDAWEQENIMLAQTLNDIQYRKRDIEMALIQVKEAQERLSMSENFAIPDEIKNNKIMLSEAQAVLKELTEAPVYTHSEIDPTAIMSIAIAIIPLPETNPGPRLTYQAGMGKQALGIYHSNHSGRFDTNSKVLAYPSRPMFETQFNEIIGLNELPSGETVILAITTYTGFSQEDSIVMAQGAVDRGLFRSIVYKTKKSVLKGNEKFVRPEVPKGKESRYAAIDENGLPRLGAFVKENDCIIGKVRITSSGKREDASEYVGVKEEGIIDRVLVSTNSENNRVVKVKLRQIRKPEIGDKFACYTPDHEVLTFNRSWVKINEITLEDKVATLVPSDDNNDEDMLVYENPTEIQEYDYNGKMYHIDSQQVDLCVTPNHRMYIKPRDKKKFIIKKAEDIHGKRVNFKRNALYEPNDEIFEIEIPAYNENQELRKIPIKPFCTLFGIFIAEGWVSSAERFPHRIDISGDKNRVRKALKEVCKEININISSDSEDKKIYIWDNQIGEYLRQFSIGAVNKYLPEWCFKLSQENSKVLLEGLMLGDGHKTKQSGSYTYYTSSKRLAKDVTQLALHAGWSANSKIKSEAGSQVWYEDENRYITTTHDAYAIPIIRTKNTPQINHGHVHQQNGQKEEWMEYTGKVYCCSVPSGIIYVRRNGKPVWCGNSRYAQKGTVGLIIPDEDMPFTESGVRPDLIINPHSLPSRMTIGKMIEIVTSKLAAFTGERVNATAFRRFDVTEFTRNLKEYGYSSSGKETMYSGYTGKPLEAMIFTGPCYYQALRHQVTDKIQMRARGDISQLTHQPVEGRKRGGGLRVGEMERDAIISHGASAFLRERLCLVSDAYETVFCSTCGNMAISNVMEEKYICRTCDDKAVFGKCTIPYAFKNLTQLLMGSGFQTRFKMKEVSELEK